MQIMKNYIVTDNPLIKPIDDKYQFLINDIYFFCRNVRGGKIFQVMKHIMITKRFYQNDLLYDMIM